MATLELSRLRPDHSLTDQRSLSYIRQAFADRSDLFYYLDIDSRGKFKFDNPCVIGKIPFFPFNSLALHK